jgi:hypothetical protein
MAVRLVAGQMSSGAWTYECPETTKDQEDLLLGTDPARPAAGMHQLKPGQNPLGQDGDNSNTQFAVLALWVAQKHGVAVAQALALAEARYRQSQGNDGSWTYASVGPSKKDAMTCAGLVAIAAGQGSRPGGGKDMAKNEHLAKDGQIERALTFLGKRLQTFGEGAPQDLNAINQGRFSYFPTDAMGDLYFMWSVERVAVLYDLDTIGGVNWHAWGADILLRVQKVDGDWEAKHGSIVDTCFALLFLKRVNVAQDLTKVIVGLGGVRDPGAKPSRTPVAELAAGNKVIPTLSPGSAKLRSGYALPAARPPGSQGRRRRRRRTAAIR